MPVKHKITPEDFQDALDYLGTTVSEIAKQTGIPRSYLSDLKNRNVPLRREYADKLRDYFENEGVPFSDTPDQPAAAAKGANPAAAASPHPRLKTTTAPRCYFPIADTVPDDVVANAMDLMEENDARLVALLKTKAKREDTLFFGEGEFTDETKAALQEAFALLAGNYLIFRMLRGWNAFGVKPAEEKPATLRDVMFDTFKEQLAQAGLIADDTGNQAGDGAQQCPDCEGKGADAGETCETCHGTGSVIPEEQAA